MKTLGVILTLFCLTAVTTLSAQEKTYQKNQDGVYMEVEVMPEFPGGFDGLKEFLMKNITYPEQAKKDTITGKVFVQFIIDETGKVTGSKVIKGVDPLLDKEALRVIDAMPVWKPGTVKGENVKEENMGESIEND